jgi:hypothetical protein
LIGASALGKDEVGEKPWRVDAPIGPTRTIAFETDAGTWLHLDVHPDGRRIVFSLLGDLYLLPLEGGDAQRITSGPAYDVQPRSSRTERRSRSRAIARASRISGRVRWTAAVLGHSRRRRKSR